MEFQFFFLELAQNNRILIKLGKLALLQIWEVSRVMPQSMMKHASLGRGNLSSLLPQTRIVCILLCLMVRMTQRWSIDVIPLMELHLFTGALWYWKWNSFQWLLPNVPFEWSFGLSKTKAPWRMFQWQSIYFTSEECGCSGTDSWKPGACFRNL